MAYAEWRDGETLLGAAERIALSGRVGTANVGTASSAGTIVKKIEVFSEAGVSLGYVPVYDAIT